MKKNHALNSPHYKLKQKRKYWNFFYSAAFMVGIVLIIFEIFIFRVTIIPYYIPLGLIIVIGFLGYLITSTHLDYVEPGGNIFLKLIYGCCSWGFIACYLFMATNYYLAENESTPLTYPIIEKDSITGSKGSRDKRLPVVRIYYKGSMKELVFTYADTDKISRAKSVYLHLKKGALGFDVISEYDAF